MYQKLIVVGNLGGDPELRYIGDSTAVCNFSLATNRRWKNAQGEQVDETTWFRISAFGPLAETCNRYLSKGRSVLVEGRLSPDPATGGPKLFAKKDGSHGASYEIRADSVQFLGGQNDNEQGDSAPSTRQQDAPRASLDADDIPF